MLNVDQNKDRFNDGESNELRPTSRTPDNHPKKTIPPGRENARDPIGDMPAESRETDPSFGKEDIPGAAPVPVSGLSDDEVIEKASKAKNGSKFQKLWDGDSSGYQSKKSAERALCSILAFYCGPDGQRIDRLFRRSGLYRPDIWEQKQGSTTYGRLMIAEVLECKKTFYRPPAPKLECKEDEEKDDPYKIPPYCVCLGKTYHRMITKKRKIQPVIIANFEAYIVEELVIDNGLEQQRIYKLEAKLGSGNHVVEIPAREFSRMDWVTELLGARAILRAGHVNKDHFRAAIQSLSSNVQERYLYRHTGWRQINNTWAFLHGGGAIDVEAVETDLKGEKLDRYDLTDHKGNPIEAVRQSLKLLSILHPRVGYPLFAIIYRAPLCHHLACTVLPHIVGPSGSFKSTLASAMLAHFGRFASKEDLSARWAFTATILEKDMFLAKDVPLVIDDLNPEAVRGNKEDLEAKFSRIIGAVGDKTGRRRATRELVTRQEYYPRGIVVSTGEYTPNLPPSRLARLLPIPMQRGDITSEDLGEFQRNLAILRAATRAYIDDMRTDFESHQKKLLSLFEEIRIKVAASLSQHARVAENVAHLQLGIEWGIAFALRMGVITESEARSHIETGLQVLTELASAQAKTLVEESVTQLFVNTLREGLMNGRAWLASRESDELTIGSDLSGSQKIGWVDEEGVYLLPGTTFKFVTDRLNYRGGLHITEQALKDALNREDLLLHNPSEYRRTDTKKRCAGVVQRVLWLRPDVLGDYEDAAEYRDEVVERLVEGEDS
jgi:hypothetical protein